MKHRETPDSIATKVREIVETAPEISNLRLGKGFFDRVERFAATLALWGQRTNLTAHPEDPSEIAFHIIDSLAPLFVSPASDILRRRVGVTVLDLGSGAGFPGLILAAATEANFTLAEARRKRASFLSVTAAEMGLDNVQVEARRVLAGTVVNGFEVFTSKAVGDAGLEVAAAALSTGGLAMFWVNHGQVIDLERAGRCGLKDVGRVEYIVRRGKEEIARALVVLEGK